LERFGLDPGSRQDLAQFFNKIKFAQNLAFSMAEAAIFLKIFLIFLNSFYVGYGSKSGSGTVMHSGSATMQSKCEN
jgi:hypothetical protein